MRVGLMVGMLALGMTSSALAHSQDPGYREIFAQDIATQTYTLENLYDFPATFEIEVLDKEGEPLESGWKLLEGQKRYKLEPGSRRRFTVLINMHGKTDRKLLVCTTLKAIGYEEDLPGNISRICSRLWVRSPG